MVFWLFCWHGLTINLGALRWSHGFLWTRFCMWTQTHFIHFIHSFLRKSNDGLSGSPVLKHPESPCMARIYRNSCHRRRRVMWPTLIQEHPLRHRLLVLLSVLPIKNMPSHGKIATQSSLQNVVDIDALFKASPVWRLSQMARHPIWKWIDA